MTRCPSCDKPATLSKDKADLKDKDIEKKGKLYFCANLECDKMMFRVRRI